MYVFKRNGILFAFAILLSACGRAGINDDSLPDASGRFSSITEEFPGVVMVLAPEGRGLCTGVVISPRAVLTAAHCLLHSGTYSVITEEGTFRTSVRFSNGPGQVDDPNDIGLLVFSAPILSDSNQVFSMADAVHEGDAVTLVGFGCSSIETRMGAGVKRMGTNVIHEKNADYLELLTPKSRSSRGIIGDSAIAGTCYGDSGGPLLVRSGGVYQVAGVTHAGGETDDYYISEFVNVADSSSNRSFLRTYNAAYSLGIVGL